MANNKNLHTGLKPHLAICHQLQELDMATFTVSSGTINSLTRTLPLTKNTKPHSLFSLSISLTLKASKFTLRASSMSYDKQLAAAKKAASLAVRLCQVIFCSLFQLLFFMVVFKCVRIVSSGLFLLRNGAFVNVKWRKILSFFLLW